MSDKLDRILCVSPIIDGLPEVLDRLGYRVSIAEDEGLIARLTKNSDFDLILLPDDMESKVFDLCDFLRENTYTRDVPILIVSPMPRLRLDEANERELSRIEILSDDMTPARIAGKIATQLRLTKLSGFDEGASQAELTAALRDFHTKLSSELEEARSIQQSLLPRTLPSDERFELAVSYEPLEEVGGDWFYVEEKNGFLWTFIADVTGHGLPAAFVGSMTKLAMHASEGKLPGDRLSSMNALLAGQIPDGRFVTVFCYRYDPRTGELLFARGGHPPGLLYRRDRKSVERLQGDGFAFGFFDEGVYEECATTIEKGEVVLVMTDALTEALNMDGAMFGIEGVERVLSLSPPEESAAELLTRLVSEFNRFRQGRRIKDDVTLIVLQRMK